MRFAGYAAIFDRPDRGGDVVRAGAFARSLKMRARLPLLWQHDPKRPVGRVEYAREDRRGLRVIARLSVGPAGRAAAAALREAQVAGLSFGYKIRRPRGERPRELEELELVEVSPVRAPMQPRARVHAVAQAGDRPAAVPLAAAPKLSSPPARRLD